MTLYELLADALRGGQSLDGPLRTLVLETKARAAGCWRLRGGQLELLGFGHADDMDDEVARGFREATQCVSLDQPGLGIVKAAVSGQPTIGHSDPTDGSLGGSATWIARFQARTSLAVPIRLASSAEIVGVLAISTGAILDPDQPDWKLLTELASQLGSAMTTRNTSHRHE